MRKRTLILHGWGGSDYPHWQSDIAADIAKDYGEVAFPLLKNPHFPTKNAWLQQLKEILLRFQPEVVICHSLANTLWFHLCHENFFEEHTQLRVKHLLLVAPPSLNCHLDTLKTFFPCEVPSTLHAQESTMVTSKTDIYMSEEEATTLASQLDVKHIVLEDAGHINAESGYGKWEFVHEWVKERFE